jgi:hypothetical protein
MSPEPENTPASAKCRCKRTTTAPVHYRVAKCIPLQPHRCESKTPAGLLGCWGGTAFLNTC